MMQETIRPDRVLVTGGAGFIGSAVIRYLLAETSSNVIVLDKMTYAASPATLECHRGNPRFSFERVDICDADAVRRVFAEYKPDAVMHLAAESHVDRSIDMPVTFIQTNVLGTGVMLQSALSHWREMSPAEQKLFRFHHISTDEVFGSLGCEGKFTESTPYSPNSPYSASKAGSDHLVRAWHHTYGMPTVLSNCSNNYGPYQFPEKLIPLMVLKGLAGETLPVYGNGRNIRDWLYVEDHASALVQVLTRGRIGESYNIGGENELTNLEVVHLICDLLDELKPADAPRRGLIGFVADRPGHDLRYAIDSTKIMRELGWRPHRDFVAGLRETIHWYLDNAAWWEPLTKGGYSGARLGLIGADVVGGSSGIPTV